VLIARKSLSHKGGLTSDPIDEIPQNAGSDAKRVRKCAAILKNFTLDTVLTISVWFPVHASVRIGII